MNADQKSVSIVAMKPYKKFPGSTEGNDNDIFPIHYKTTNTAEEVTVKTTRGDLITTNAFTLQIGAKESVPLAT